jgi:hypothetical protein
MATNANLDVAFRGFAAAMTFRDYRPVIFNDANRRAVGERDGTVFFFAFALPR